MDRPPALAHASPWLAAPIVAPDTPLAAPHRDLATSLLGWMRQPDGPTSLEVLFDARVGGSVRGCLRAQGALSGELALLAEASEQALAEDPAPDAAAPLAHVQPVFLGEPVAWLHRHTRPGNHLPARCRWFAERGRHLRLRLRLSPLPPLPVAQNQVARHRAASSVASQSWDPFTSGLEHAERILDACVFTLTIESRAPLGPAERTLLLGALQMDFTPLARLDGPAQPALAESKLALRLLESVVGVWPESQGDDEGDDRVGEPT